MPNYVALSYGQVALAAALIIVNGALSVVLSLRLERTLALAAARTAVQLLLVGFVLEWVFRPEHRLWLYAWAVVMTVIAGWTASRRPDRAYRGLALDALLSVWASTWLATAYVLLLVLHGSTRWDEPQFAVPLLGMTLGNALTGIALGLGGFLEMAELRRYEVETRLTLGATRWEAALPLIQDAVRTGMIPIVNSMLVVGLVSLPGMMTGQLVSGASPIEAVKYQIVIMFLVAAATGIGTALAVLLAYRRLFDGDHRFRAERLVRRG